MANEKRLIDANEFLKALNERPLDFLDVGGDFGYFDETIDSVVNEQPTVDAVEVVHGRWKYYHKQNIAVCTNCSFERDLDANFGKAISCPNCGAKMDGDGNA